MKYAIDLPQKSTKNKHFHLYISKSYKGKHLFDSLTLIQNLVSNLYLLILKSSPYPLPYIQFPKQSNSQWKFSILTPFSTDGVEFLAC